MSVEINGDTFVHTHESAGTNTAVRRMPDGGLSIACQLVGGIIDVMTYAERIELARWMLQDVAWGPNQTMASFVAGISGPNGRADRLAYVASFGAEWADTEDATALRTWINYQDSQNLVGVWDERVRRYYTDRGFPR